MAKLPLKKKIKTKILAKTVFQLKKKVEFCFELNCVFKKIFQKNKLRIMKIPVIWNGVSSLTNSIFKRAKFGWEVQIILISLIMSLLYSILPSTNHLSKRFFSIHSVMTALLISCDEERFTAPRFSGSKTVRILCFCSSHWQLYIRYTVALQFSS